CAGGSYFYVWNRFDVW
nr:immunoglobulin heavy chain junction region [Macaca mulatta]MOV39788.1 immunoglobulin heavy chain junction region [Macaca mulatta]MOV39951.1 immunoglobulin heavy chain junction region [Macaca mulatta]MOV44589.1 immunoglobulin heavy chain junction region [Macaca mulatta]MOV44708.1 immunoglobulin heavy chain junction region [Macaca mulatta]